MKEYSWIWISIATATATRMCSVELRRAVSIFHIAKRVVEIGFLSFLELLSLLIVIDVQLTHSIGTFTLVSTGVDPRLRRKIKQQDSNGINQCSY